MSFEQSANELRMFVERVERLDEEIAGLKDDRKDVLAEAKAQGFDPAIIRKVIARRKLTPAERDEADSLLATYETALESSGIIDGGTIEGGILALPAPDAPLPTKKLQARRASMALAHANADARTL